MPPPENFSGRLLRPTPKTLLTTGSIRSPHPLSSTRRLFPIRQPQQRRHASPPSPHPLTSHHHATPTAVITIVAINSSPQPPQPHHGGVGLVVATPLLPRGTNPFDHELLVEANRFACALLDYGLGFYLDLTTEGFVSRNVPHSRHPSPLDTLWWLGLLLLGHDAGHLLVENLGNAEEKAKCEKLKKDLEEARGFVFEERPNEAIDVPVVDQKSPSYKLRGSPHDSYVDAAIVAKRARHTNAGNDARGYGPVRGQDVALVVREFTFAGFMKCNPTVFHGTEGAVELRRWFEKTKSVFGISKCAEGKKVKFNELALMCLRMDEPKSVKVDTYIRGLTDNIKGEVTSSKPANMNEAVRMAHKLME
ncbi:hypothetical protein Tco_0730966 [Tanacetum coccineum]